MSLHTPAMHTPALPHFPAWAANAVMVLLALVLAFAVLLIGGAIVPASQTTQTWSAAEIQAAHQAYRAGERAMPLMFSQSEIRDAWTDYRTGERAIP